jgi:hypothetical protein
MNIPLQAPSVVRVRRFDVNLSATRGIRASDEATRRAASMCNGCADPRWCDVYMPTIRQMLAECAKPFPK